MILAGCVTAPMVRLLIPLALFLAIMSSAAAHIPKQCSLDEVQLALERKLAKNLRMQSVAARMDAMAIIELLPEMEKADRRYILSITRLLQCTTGM